jgi:hypothetical protein
MFNHPQNQERALNLSILTVSGIQRKRQTLGAPNRFSFSPYRSSCIGHFLPCYHPRSRGNVRSSRPLVFCGPPVENTLSGGISTYLKHPLGGHPPPCARCDRPELPGLATGLACRLSETILASPVPAGVALIPETLSSPPQPLYGALAPCEFRDDVLAGFNANYFASCCSRPGLLFDLVSFPVLSQITVVPEERQRGVKKKH